jgi:PiT family inorganic phosphate transporter
MGAGAARRLSAVRWGVAGNIATAWVLTLPAAGLFGAVIYWVQRLPGPGVEGPLMIIAVVAAVGAYVLVARRARVADPGMVRT